MDSIEAALADLRLLNKPNFTATAKKHGCDRTTLSRQFRHAVCCNYPCAGPAPLGIAVAVAIGIAGATQLECASVEATQLGMGMGSAPKGART